MKKKGIIVSGYFNPLHKGHLEYLIQAKELGDDLFVIVNSDLQRALKGSKEFQNESERLFIMENLRVVDYCILSCDTDRTVIKSLEQIHNDFSDSYNFAFANGGDQNNDTIPEKQICQELGIELYDGLGDKIQSSSRLLKSK